MSWGRKRTKSDRRNKLKTETLNSQRAVLWDLDGTIVDSALYHKLAWRETFTKRGLDFTEDNFIFSFGRRNEEIIRKLISPSMSPQEIAIISDEKEETFRRLMKNSTKALPGVLELLESLAKAKFKLALASSTPGDNVRLITEILGIKNDFKVFIAGEDVSEGKPSPQVFLLAAQKLGVQPQNCVVIEDAVVGVRAAKRGGMYCIAVTNTSPKEALSEADIVIDSLEKITVGTVGKLFNNANK